MHIFFTQGRHDYLIRQISSLFIRDCSWKAEFLCQKIEFFIIPIEGSQAKRQCQVASDATRGAKVYEVIITLYKQ